MKLLKQMELNLSKNQKYILTCSFGPDSMCLFDLLLKENYDFMIAHVNYHLRKEEPSEVEILIKICEKNKIPLDILDVWMPKGVNEEGWARKVRYDYFSETARKYGIENVLVAHNEDDLLETYLLQKRRGNIVSFYGLKEVYEYKDAKIIRPLLKIPKAKLREYCDENHVPYGLDLSNFDTHYARNKLRKEVVKDMPREQRDLLLKEIDDKNKIQNDESQHLLSLVNNHALEVNKLLALSVEEFYLLMILYFESEHYYHPLSKKFICDLFSIIKSKTTWHHAFTNKDILALDYGFLRLYQLKVTNYEITSSNDLIMINDKSSLYYLIKNKEYKIKNGVKSNELYVFNGLKKRVGRCFIDWKVPYVYRLLWPIIYDKDGEIIYIPHYQRDYKMNEDSLIFFNIGKFLK